jgi:hypothetical protein
LKQGRHRKTQCATAGNSIKPIIRIGRGIKKPLRLSKVVLIGVGKANDAEKLNSGLSGSHSQWPSKFEASQIANQCEFEESTDFGSLIRLRSLCRRSTFETTKKDIAPDICEWPCHRREQLSPVSLRLKREKALTFTDGLDMSWLTCSAP